MGSPSVPTPSWNPANAGMADSTYATNLSGLSGVAGQGYGIANNIVNNPYSAQGLAGAQAAGGYLTGTLAPQLYGASSNLYNATNSGLPYAQSILQAGFDPQSALYNRTQQQNQDQSLALLNATGVGQTPYGAGVAAQNNSNFNIDWQNQQLGRESTALGAYNNYLGAAGNSYTTAGNLGSAGAGAYTTGSSLPSATYLSQQGAGLGALGQAGNLYNSAASSAGNYLGLTNQNYGTQQLPYYNAQYQANQGLWSGLGSILGLGTGGLNNTVGGSALSWLGGFL